MKVRAATVEELIDLRHAVLRPGRPRSTACFDGDRCPSTRHWAAAERGHIIGVVTVLERDLPDPHPSGSRWQLRGMAVHPDFRGRGVGRALLETVQREVGAPMWCNARVEAVGFYRRCGWSALGAPFSIAPIGLHVRMVWTG